MSEEITADWFEEKPPTEEQVREAKLYLYQRSDSQRQAIILFEHIKHLRTQTLDAFVAELEKELVDSLEWEWLQKIIKQTAQRMKGDV